MINLKNFLKDNDIHFESEKKALRWIRLMKSTTLDQINEIDHFSKNWGILFCRRS